MIEMRKNGATYPEIIEALGVTKWMCIQYLKNVEVEKRWVREEWQEAEAAAKHVLDQMGFSHILNLNEICSAAPSWDFYAAKGETGWLIDVTINGQKSVLDKHVHLVDGFNHAILYKKGSVWELIEVKKEVVGTFMEEIVSTERVETPRTKLFPPF